MENQTTSTQITTKITESLYDYPEIFQSVVKQGKEMFGNKYAIDDIDRPVINKLITYFLQDEGVAEALNIDLYKGLLIGGPVGCGKTSIMTILNALLPKDRKFQVESCCGVALEYMGTGHKIIQRNTTGSFESLSRAPKTFYYDDFGIEQNASYFGNTRNVMGEILLHRYDYYMQYHMLTYLSTNLNSSELEERYGLRLRSRIRQMCQLISFSPDSRDKRQ